MSQPTEILSERMEQKLALLVQLRDLGLCQSTLIEAGDMTQLLRLLAAKQRLLAAVQSVERHLEPFRNENPDERVWISPAHRRRCAETVAVCEELLRGIVEQERQSEIQMQRRREEAAMQLQGVHSAAEIRDAYLPEPSAAPGQFDLTQG